MATRRVVARKVPKELAEQRKFCAWMDKHNITYFMIPNSGWRSKEYAEHMKYYGLKKGVPDLMIAEPVFQILFDHNGRIDLENKDHKPDIIYPGLFIEMKKQDYRDGNGKIKRQYPSENQREWLQKLSDKGYIAKVARGAEEAIAITKSYLGMEA